MSMFYRWGEDLSTGPYWKTYFTKKVQHIILRVIIYLYKYIIFIYVMSTYNSILKKKILRITFRITYSNNIANNYSNNITNNFANNYRIIIRKLTDNLANNLRITLPNYPLDKFFFFRYPKLKFFVTAIPKMFFR